MIYPNWSAIITTKDLEEITEMDIFPNPAVDILNVKYNSSKQVTYSLYKVNGVLVNIGTIRAHSQVEIDNSKLPSGVFYLRLEDGIKQKSERILKL